MPFAKTCFISAAVFLAWGCSPHKGVVDFGDGRYSGDFDKEGRRDGEGIYHWNNGDHYEGPFLKGKRHGKGVFVWANGDRYTGDYRNGKRHGYGSYNWINGSSYNGQYAFGKRHGRGTFITAEQSRYDGWWRDDLEEGQGILTYPDGRRVEGRWSRGELRTETTTIIAPPAPAERPALSTEPSVDSSLPHEPAVVNPPTTSLKRQSINWSGTEKDSLSYFEPRIRGEVDAIHVKGTGEPFEGTITILLDNGSKRGQVSVVNGLLHGEEILWGEDGKVMERNRYENGKLIEEQIVPQPAEN